MISEIEVIHEEIVTHPTAEHKINGWWAEARILGFVKINGKMYSFNKVLKFRLADDDSDD